MSHFKGPDITTALPEFKPNTSVLNLCVEALRRNGDHIAMIEGQTGKSATFRELLQNGSSVAAGLRSAGVTAGDYVIICCDKSITAYSLLLGVIFTGATAVLVPIPHINIAHKLTKGFKIKGAFCDPQNLGIMKESLNQMIYQPEIIGTADVQDKVMSSFLKCKDKFKPYEVKDVRNHVPMVFFSSGTTGDPKGILVRDTYVQLCGFYFGLKVKSFCIASPIYWVSSLTVFMSSVFNNFCVVWSNSTTPVDNLKLLQKYKVEGWCTSTGSLSAYVNEPSLREYDLSSLKYAAVGGEYAVSSAYNDFVKKVLGGRIKLLNGYGSTEGGLMAMTHPEHTTEPFRVGMVGPLIPGVEARILDDKGDMVPVGKLGKVWFKSLAVTPGYWGRPDVDREAFDKDGFIHIGDAGMFDSKGYLYLRGRVGDLINYKGTKVSPAEVEDILMSHEAVLDAAVIGKPHPTDIQHLTAYVVLNKGFKITEKELQEFIDSQTDDVLKLRGGVHFLNSLPRTVIGKVQRKLLREL